MKITEGTVPVRDGHTWYRIVGKLRADATPLVILHGGPGGTHEYLSSLERLASPARPVIFYDQLGCGRSWHFPERGDEFFTVDLFLEELDLLLAEIGITDQYHLLGQSWGGMLAAEHAVRCPAGLRGLVISNSPASMETWVTEATRLRQELPPHVRDVLDAHEQAGTLDDPRYKAATQAFYDQHVCRVVPNPPEVKAAFAALDADPTVYRVMNGPNEFYCVGTLRTWSIVDRLHEIIAPTLLLSGAFDEATPATVQPYKDEIPGARWTVFPNSSHMPFVEEPAAYDEVVTTFLDEVDAR